MRKAHQNWTAAAKVPSICSTNAKHSAAQWKASGTKRFLAASLRGFPGSPVRWATHRTGARRAEDAPENGGVDARQHRHLVAGGDARALQGARDAVNEPYREIIQCGAD